jgi:hypothetical protein
MIGDALSAEDVLRGLELPAAVAGCDLLDGPGETFDVQSRGPLGGKHGTLFEADGDSARIVGIGKIGWLGHRHLDTPIERHVEVLRELGFAHMILRSGKQYEIRQGWPGVKRIRE